MSSELGLYLARVQLQALHAAIRGVRSAGMKYPADLASAQVPYVLTWPGTGRWQSLAMNDKRRMDREFIVRCFHSPIAQGSPEKPPEGLEDLMWRFGEAYTSPENADQSITVAGVRYQIVILGEGIEDSGIGVLPYAGIAYHGFEFRVPVYIKWDVTL